MCAFSNDHDALTNAENIVPVYNRRMNAIVIRSGRNIKLRGAGFTLVELAIGMVIIGLLFALFMPVGSTLLNNKKRELTRQKMKNIETAIANYVAINKRLPCPADGSSSAGSELRDSVTGDCTSNQVNGVAPWVSIGLTQADIEDGWNRRITYKAGFGLTRDNALDMSSCDPAGTKPAPTTDTSGTAPPGGRCWATCIRTDMATCTPTQAYLAGKGFDIRDGAGTTKIMDAANYTGAAYVLISHGDNGYGAFSSKGTYIATAAPGVNGIIEGYNLATVSVASGVPATANTFRDADFSEGTASTQFDDVVIRPSVFSVIQRAQIGPRSH